MVLRKFILGAAAVALTASTAVAGGLDAAGTEDDEVGPIIAGPAGTGAGALFGGLSTTAVVGAAAGAVVLGAIIANATDDDDDDGGTNGTPGTP